MTFRSEIRGQCNRMQPAKWKVQIKTWCKLARSIKAKRHKTKAGSTTQLRCRQTLLL